MKNYISLFVIAILSSLFTFTLLEVSEQQEEPTASTSSTFGRLVKNNNANVLVNASPRLGYADLKVDFVLASNRVKNSVVNITSIGAYGRVRANGSGVVYTADGYIITNSHVVENGAGFEVSFPDKKRYPARLVGLDKTTDLALLKVGASNLDPITIGDSDEIQVGEWVLAVGNPFNLTSTVTAGIVSAKGRNLNIIEDSYSIESFIQTDAVVNPGNSGGALVNTKGELIGINTAILSKTGAYQGYSFAIPANLARKVVDDLKEFGEVKRAILGVTIGEVGDVQYQRLGLPFVGGVFVNSVNVGGSADKAGLRSGDVIIGVNDKKVKSVPELQEIIARYRPGQRVKLKFYRNGKPYTLENVILGEVRQNEFK